MTFSLRFFCALAAVWLGVLGVGCKDSCRQLSEQLCECAENQVSKTSCLTRAANEDSRIAPSAGAQVVCQNLLNQGQCDCNHLDTLQGKRNCGLAR